MVRNQPYRWAVPTLHYRMPKMSKVSKMPKIGNWYGVMGDSFRRVALSTRPRVAPVYSLTSVNLSAQREAKKPT